MGEEALSLDELRPMLALHYIFHRIDQCTSRAWTWTCSLALSRFFATITFAILRSSRPPLDSDRCWLSARLPRRLNEGKGYLYVSVALVMRMRRASLGAGLHIGCFGRRSGRTERDTYLSRCIIVSLSVVAVIVVLVVMLDQQSLSKVVERQSIAALDRYAGEIEDFIDGLRSGFSECESCLIKSPTLTSARDTSSVSDPSAAITQCCSAIREVSMASSRSPKHWIFGCITLSIVSYQRNPPSCRRSQFSRGPGLKASSIVFVCRYLEKHRWPSQVEVEVLAVGFELVAVVAGADFTSQHHPLHCRFRLLRRSLQTQIVRCDMSKPTADWERVGDRFYRKIQLYTSIFDQDIELENYQVVGAPFSGAVGRHVNDACVMELTRASSISRREQDTELQSFAGHEIYHRCIQLRREADTPHSCEQDHETGHRAAQDTENMNSGTKALSKAWDGPKMRSW